MNATKSVSYPYPYRELEHRLVAFTRFSPCLTYYAIVRNDPRPQAVFPPRGSISPDVTLL